MKRIPPWFVFGAGAMGTATCHRLGTAGVASYLLHHRDAAGSRQLRVAEREVRIPVQAIATQAEGSIERLLLATKAGQVATALSTALPYLAPQAVVLVIANGMGFERRLDLLAEAPRIYRGISTAAAYREDPEHVVSAAQGRTHVGALDTADSEPAWFSDSLGRLPDWEWHSPLRDRLARKFAINCVINPLTAVLRCRNGELLTGAARDELRALCDETQPALEQLGMWPRGEQLLTVAEDVCASTTANRSSMLQDVLAGRETEIRFLNAELLHLAGEKGLALPINRRLVTLLT